MTKPAYVDQKSALQKRLKRIEGQVRGLERMVDEDEYCINILVQISATTRALQAVAMNLLDDHLSLIASPRRWQRVARALTPRSKRLKKPSVGWCAHETNQQVPSDGPLRERPYR